MPEPSSASHIARSWGCVALGMPAMPACLLPAAIHRLSPNPFWGSRWGRRHRPGVGGYDQPQQFPSLPKTAAKANIVMQNATVTCIKKGKWLFGNVFQRENAWCPEQMATELFFLNIFSNSVVDAELFCSLPSLLAPQLLSVAHSSCNSNSPPFQKPHHVTEQKNHTASSCFLHK